MSDYPFSREPALDRRNIYNYFPFSGSEFLTAWRKEREKCLALAPEENTADGGGRRPGPFEPENGFSVDELLGWIHDDDEDLTKSARYLEAIVQRFEVTKKVYERYDANARAVDREAYRRLDCYVSFAELMETAYARTGDLPYLNALLKCDDIVCSHFDELEKPLRARAAAVVRKEMSHVSELSAKAGVVF